MPNPNPSVITVEDYDRSDISYNYMLLAQHRGHRVEIVIYAKDSSLEEVSLECQDCKEIICSFPKGGPL